VTRANVGELASLIRFAKSAQLDWLKLEEIFGHDELAIDRYSLDVAVANARKLGDDLGVPVLDHTRAMQVWRCQLDVDARMKKRAALDDFVNRAEINPCRAPWETICLEPNGDVRPISFHHPIAGNVVDTPLDVLWRSAPAFVESRRIARNTRLCGAGPTTCAKDPGPRSW
jgi:MoaA/NifB/PqqE/SkfB family radical SAM enzyme